jgi:hypothetical protein
LEVEEQHPGRPWVLPEERRERVRECGGRYEGTNQDTIWLSNKEMQSLWFFSLATSKAVLPSCGESERGRESEMTSF